MIKIPKETKEIITAFRNVKNIGHFEKETRFSVRSVLLKGGYIEFTRGEDFGTVNLTKKGELFLKNLEKHVGSEYL